MTGCCTTERGCLSSAAESAMWKLKPVKNANPDCVQAVYDCFAAFSHVPIFMHFLDKWDFEADWHSEAMPDLYREAELLSDFHGLCIQKVGKSAASDQRIFNSLTRERVLQVICDGFDCCWTELYRKTHTTHSFLVAGYDEKTDEAVLADPYFSQERIGIPRNKLALLGELQMRSLYFAVPKRTDYRNAIEDRVEYLRQKNYLDRMREFVEHIPVEHMLDQTMTDLKYDPRLVFIKNFSNKYVNLLTCFEHVARADHDFDAVISRLREIAETVVVLKDLTIKGYVRKSNRQFGQLRELMFRIIHLESALFEELSAIGV